MEKKSPRILSKLSKSSKSSTLGKDFKNKSSAGSSASTLDDSSTLKSSKVSLSIKELKKAQEKQNKLQQQQLKLQQQQLKNEIKLQQKQLKIQQKKNEKEQKSNTLKSNKNKSSSTGEVQASELTTSSANVVIDDEKRFSDGVRFRGKLVGIEPVMASRGDKMCQNALKNLRLLRRSTSSHKQRIIININLNGVQLLDQKTNDMVANHVINLISYITRDITDNRTFGYVYGTPDVGHQFIAIKSEKDSMFVMNAIGELFTYVYNKKKKEREKQELESKTQFESVTDNSQSSHTLVDDRQPQNQGYDNETLMEFLKGYDTEFSKQQREKSNSQASNSQTLPAIAQEFDYEKENRYVPQATSAASKYSTLPPPLPSRNLDSAQSNYSSNSNLNSYGAYSQSNYDSNYLGAGSANYQSNISLATTTQDGSCSEMQQMQNVISSARKANDKFKGWQMFEDSNNNEKYAGSNSLISEKDDDDDDSVIDNNWANFESPPEPPNYPPPSLYLSNENMNEDVSIATTSQDTYTLTNEPSGDINQHSCDINQLSGDINQAHNQTTATDNSKQGSLNNSQNTAFVVRLDTPPASARRRRRSERLSESSIDRQTDSLTMKKNQFESNFNNQQTGSNEFFDFDKVNNRRSLSKEFNTSYDSNRDSGGSRNDSRNSTHLNQFDGHFNDNFDEKFDRNFDKQFDNQEIDKQFGSLRRKSGDMKLVSNQDSLNRFGTNSSIEGAINYETKSVKLTNQPTQYSSFDSTMNQAKKENAQSSRLSVSSSLSNKKSSFDSNELNQFDPNDKYAVFNEIGTMKFSIFAGDEAINEDEHVFLANKEPINKMQNQKTNLSSLDSSHNQQFEDSFLSNISLDHLKESNNKSIEQQLNQSMKIQSKNDRSQIDSISSVSSYQDPGLMVECHQKFLQERQEKLDQIDSIFESEKAKIRARQRELNAEHLKQQKSLLNQQKTYQQEFYQRQKHQRQTILHQLQLQRLPVVQFDQCKLQLQQKLKDDQKFLQQEFIKRQQELKKRQTADQSHVIQQYKLLEAQYLEKQSELLNSDFEIEIDLPDVPNIFDNDESMQNEQALSRKFELSLKNEFDKLTNEIIQTTTSSLNSSPKMSERCSTACSITSSCSHNPFMMDQRTEDKLNTSFMSSDDSLKLFDKNLFEDFDRALNLIDKKIDWSCKGSNSSTNGTLNRKFDLDLYMFGTSLNEHSKDNSKENSLDYCKNDLNKSLNEQRISSACSLETNRSISTLPGTFQVNNLVNLNKSLNNESFQSVKLNTGYEQKAATLNPHNSFRSQQHLLTNDSFSQSMIGNFIMNQKSQRSSFNQPILPQQFESQFGHQHQLNSQKNDKTDPFNTQTIDTKLSEMNRIKELRQHTQQQLVSLTLPEGNSQTNTSVFNSMSKPENRPMNQLANQPVNHNQPPKEDKKPNTSIQELEELLGLSTCSLNKESKLSTSQQQSTVTNAGLVNASVNLNSSLNRPNQSKPSELSTNKALNSKMFENLFDLKKNSSMVNFTNSFNQVKTNSGNNSLADYDFKKNSSLSFQDLRTEQFMNSLQKNQLQSTLQLKNSLDVFGTVVVGDLNNQKTAKKLFNHFGADHQSPHDIFNTKEDPFKDDFFNS